MTDIAVIGQDPGFRGGVTAMSDAFLRATHAAGRDAQLLYLRYRALDRARASHDRFEEVNPVLPGLDALNQAVAARRLAARVRRARTAWVVSTVASHGAAAPRSGRAYGAWIGTSLADEWAGRRQGLGPRRRAALRASTSGLLRLERRVLREAAALYAISPHAARGLADAGDLTVDAIEVLPIPVDLTDCTPAPEHRWREGLERPTIIFVGRADDPRKNLPLLLRAFAQLREQVADVRLDLVGSPPAGPHPPGVVATGVVPSVGAALRVASLLVLPSLQEGFGLVAAEAMACGVPVVTTPCGGPEDLVRTSGAGIVLEGFSPDELAVTLEALLGDPGRLAAMRSAGRAHVEREYAPERFQERVAAAITRVEAAS